MVLTSLRPVHRGCSIGGENLRRNSIFAYSQIISSKIFMNYKGRSSDLTVGKPHRWHLTKSSRSASPVMGLRVSPPATGQRRAQKHL